MLFGAGLLQYLGPLRVVPLKASRPSREGWPWDNLVFSQIKSTSGDLLLPRFQVFWADSGSWAGGWLQVRLVLSLVSKV
jgi:hypothetical protein